jgi:hypothetical protein
MKRTAPSTTRTKTLRQKTDRSAALNKARRRTSINDLPNDERFQIAMLMSLLNIPASEAKNMLNFSRQENTSKATAATVIQTKWRTFVRERIQKLERFKTDLVSHLPTNTNKRYYSSLIDNIVSQTGIILRMLKDYINTRGHFPFYTEFKMVVNTRIGPCHMTNRNLPIQYLKKIINGLFYVSHEYSKMNPTQKDEYMKRAVSEIGGRPCLENFIEALQSALYEPSMTWTGRNIIPLAFPAELSNKDRYLSVLAKSIGSYMTNTTKTQLKNLNTNNARIQRFWNVVKNKQLSVVNANGNPAFIAVKNYNTNGKIFKNSGPSAANYVTLYLN